MDNLPVKMKIIGFYCTDAEDVYNTPGTLRVSVETKYDKYLPIVNLLNINQASEIKFSDGENKQNEIVSYTRAGSSKNLDEPTVRSKRINITQNDLFLGPIRVVLNFTSKPVSFSTGPELRKTFTKITQDKLSDYAGKLLVFSIHTLNSVDLINMLTGNADYLETLINKLQGHHSSEVKETRYIYEYAQTKIHMFKRKFNGELPNSIKVITLHEIDEEVFSGGKQYYVRSLDSVVSQGTIIDLNNNPNTSAVDHRDLADIYRDNSLMVFIVDKNNSIGDRFINIAGHVRTIPRSKNRNIPDGLYFSIADGKGGSLVETSSPLSEMDSSGFVYKSIEEANTGADLKGSQQQELELARTNLEHLKMQSSADTHRFKVQQEELRLKHEQDLHRLKQEGEKLKLDRDLESMSSKTNHEHKKFNFDTDREHFKHRMEQHSYDMANRSLSSKHHYEIERYRRDSTVETLKTVGALAGAAAVIYIAYTKMAG